MESYERVDTGWMFYGVYKCAGILFLKLESKELLIALIVHLGSELSFLYLG